MTPFAGWWQQTLQPQMAPDGMPYLESYLALCMAPWLFPPVIQPTGACWWGPTGGPAWRSRYAGLPPEQWQMAPPELRPGPRWVQPWPPEAPAQGWSSPPPDAYAPPMGYAGYGGTEPGTLPGAYPGAAGGALGPTFGLGQ